MAGGSEKLSCLDVVRKVSILANFFLLSMLVLTAGVSGRFLFSSFEMILPVSVFIYSLLGAEVQ